MDHSRMPNRKDNLDWNALGDELMIYDTETEVAYCLDPLAARVFQACDGHTRKAHVAKELLPGTECAGDLLEVTLSELHQQGLLKERVRGALSRRSFLAKWGAAAATLPIIASISAPAPGHALSATTTEGPTTAAPTSTTTTTSQPTTTQTTTTTTSTTTTPPPTTTTTTTSTTTTTTTTLPPS